MSHDFEQTLSSLMARAASPLSGSMRGIEKESLRVDSDGSMSKLAHPRSLGSPLTNQFITTDFSEALLEFVTPVFGTTWEAMRSICDIHQFVQNAIDDELLWPASMPCLLPKDEAIPLARYGTSNIGRMKTTYRRGLGYRYGRQMQTISGVHYNFSLPEAFWPEYQAVLEATDEECDFRSTQYLGLVRNFRRMGWIILYLFGASPALCQSFAQGRELDMPMLNETTYFEPYGTSLRMSDLGYNNKNQSRIAISLNSLDSYIRDLTAAIHTPEPDYEKIGVLVDGEYRQLNANQLQIENEYYSSVRPKRVARSGERPTAALRRGGIEYVEVRSLDCNLYDPAGISQNTMRFIEPFLVYCLLEDSPMFDQDLLAECVANQALVARAGRDPELRLSDRGESRLLTEWADRIVEKVEQVAAVMDDDSTCYSEAVAEMRKRIEDASLTPSARILEDLREEGMSFFELALDAARRHKKYFRLLTPLNEEVEAKLQQEVSDSLARQSDIEAEDTLSFEEYLESWFDAD